MIKREVMDSSDVQEVRVVSASVVAQLQAQGLQVRNLNKSVNFTFK